MSCFSVRLDKCITANLKLGRMLQMRGPMPRCAFDFASACAYIGRSDIRSVYKQSHLRVACVLATSVCSMDCDDLVEDCIASEQECDARYLECHGLHDRGMVFAAHQLMLKNIDTCVDLGSRQSELYSDIKRDHTLVFAKCQQVHDAQQWTACSVSHKGKGIDDAIKISTSSTHVNSFLIDAQLDAGLAQCVVLASRLEFANTWIKAVSTAVFVRQLSGHSHVARVTVSNPFLSVLGGTTLYLRVDSFDNRLFDQQYIVIVSPLSAADAAKHGIAGDKYQGSAARLFSFSSLTFVFVGARGAANIMATDVKVHVQNMQIVRYTPAYLNSFVCVDFFARMCRHWANIARQLGDMLYDGERLLDLVKFLETSPLGSG